MGFVGILFKRIIPAVLLLIASFLGYIATVEMGLARVFTIVYPTMNGKLPPAIFGHGKMEGTPPVPDDMQPQPRPENELFATLPGDYLMPRNGLGMCCRYSAYDDVLVRRTVLWYLLLGGRLIDGAHMYLNHKAIGLGIKDAIERGIPRSEIFFTTKIAPTHFGYNSTMELIPKFLEETGLDYIDLVLMHAPVRFPLVKSTCKSSTNKECNQDTWKALSELRERGVMKSIGVSNFGIETMQEIQELDLAPIAVNQIQWNAFSPPKQQKTHDYCIENGIAVTAYFSLGGSHQKHLAPKVEVFQKLATKYNVSTSKLMLRWSVQNGACVIPGTGNPKHMKENLEIYDFEIAPEDMEAIDALRHDEVAANFMHADYDEM